MLTIQTKICSRTDFSPKLILLGVLLDDPLGVLWGRLWGRNEIINAIFKIQKLS